MEIIERNIEELIPYENNPRNNDAAVEYVANSIREFGFKNPIIIDRNNVIVAGHTRAKAAEKLGMVKVPTIMADDLTDEQIQAFRLADNKVSEFSGWNFSILEKELEELELTFDMQEFGFNDAEKIEIESESDDKEVDFSESWEVIVECENESQQESLYNRLTKEGYTCRISTL